jgi:hypothetical protein
MTWLLLWAMMSLQNHLDVPKLFLPNNKLKITAVTRVKSDKLDMLITWESVRMQLLVAVPTEELAN